MQEKLNEIVREVEKTRVYSEAGGYLSTDRFIVFLLFGANDERRDKLLRCAENIVAEKNAVDFVSAVDPASAVRGVEQAIENASRVRARVQDLYHIHLCPVIFSDDADYMLYRPTLAPIAAKLAEQDRYVALKPFLILVNPTSPRSKSWLDAVGDGIRERENNALRCCLMTSTDEKGFEVPEARLLNTVLLTAFLSVMTETENALERNVGYNFQEPDNVFYTAQTVLLGTPVVIRTLRRINDLRERLVTFGDESPRDIDMTFVGDILKPLFAKLPRDPNNLVSLAPLYAVMPGVSGGSDELRARLMEFSNQYYLAGLQGEEEKRRLFREIGKGFLRAFVYSDKPLSDLAAMSSGNLSQLAARAPLGLQISQLPPYPSSAKISENERELYGQCAAALTRKLLEIGKELLGDYFRSGDFSELPKRFHTTENTVKSLGAEITSVSRLQEQKEVLLPLVSDPDEQWLNNFDDTRKKADFIEYFCAIALAETDEEQRDTIVRLLDMLFAAAKSMRGDNDAKKYMQLLSDTCLDANGAPAKACAGTISDKLIFPIRIPRDKVSGSEAYVWGDPDNNLKTALEKNHDLAGIRYEYLDVKSDERFVILRVSRAFAERDILGVAKTAEAAREEDDAPDPAVTADAPTDDFTAEAADYGTPDVAPPASESPFDFSFPTPDAAEDWEG
ncbi:MAG: hypothetical protein LBT12_07295 [Oscillospiraceae bacterium]|jgi:hypothetical protein|nr:hypothetical protein [Oscillospiraceae bacterium]